MQRLLLLLYKFWELFVELSLELREREIFLLIKISFEKMKDI